MGAPANEKPNRSYARVQLPGPPSCYGSISSSHSTTEHVVRAPQSSPRPTTSSAAGARGRRREPRRSSPSSTSGARGHRRGARGRGDRRRRHPPPPELAGGAETQLDLHRGRSRRRRPPPPSSTRAPAGRRGRAWPPAAAARRARHARPRSSTGGDMPCRSEPRVELPGCPTLSSRVSISCSGAPTRSLSPSRRIATTRCGSSSGPAQ